MRGSSASCNGSSSARRRPFLTAAASGSRAPHATEPQPGWVRGPGLPAASGHMPAVAGGDSAGAGAWGGLARRNLGLREVLDMLNVGQRQRPQAAFLAMGRRRCVHGRLVVHVLPADATLGTPPVGHTVARGDVTCTGRGTRAASASTMQPWRGRAGAHPTPTTTSARQGQGRQKSALRCSVLPCTVHTLCPTRLADAAAGRRPPFAPHPLIHPPTRAEPAAGGAAAQALGAGGGAGGAQRGAVRGRRGGRGAALLLARRGAAPHPGRHALPGAAGGRAGRRAGVREALGYAQQGKHNTTSLELRLGSLLCMHHARNMHVPTCAATIR